MKQLSACGITLLCLSLILTTCTRVKDKSFAIRDFNTELQPVLKSLVNRGYVDDDSLNKRFSNTVNNEDLDKLVWSEHPLIRIAAIMERLRRDSLADNTFIKEHLGDTATVINSIHRWSDYSTVADVMLGEAEWASNSRKMEMAREVILHHNQLAAAFNVLVTIQPEPALYPAIREMAVRERFFQEREKALLALASYRRPEDTALLTKILLANSQDLEESSFKLMQLYPNGSYIDVLHKFFMWQFSSRVCRDYDEFYEPTVFNCLAGYKQTKSAELLSKIWSWSAPRDCTSKWDQMKDYLLEAIWENKCEAYADLLRTTAAAKKEYESHILRLDIPVVNTDTMPKQIRWLW